MVGTVEVKCLKILKGHAMQEYINNFENGKISDQVKRQCFYVDGGSLVLKKVTFILFSGSVTTTHN